MSDAFRAMRVQVLVAFMCVALVVYFVLLGRAGVVLVTSGRPAAIGLGVAVFLLPVVGLWTMIATLRAGFAHQRLARMAREQGADLDVSELPRMPSGRIRRDAADALFAEVRIDVEENPQDWRRWYRLARAYDYAGDRSRARETMKTAMRLEEESR